MQSAMDWVGGQRAESGWSMRSLLVLSLVGHLCLVLGLMLTPGPAPLRMPQALTIDLVAAIPAAPKPPAPAPAPRPVAAPAPKPKPKPKPKVKILPKQAPSVQLKPKPKPEPKPEPALRRRPRPKELAYEDALAQLRGELGEPAAVAAPKAAESPAPSPVPGPSSARPSRGVKVDPELLAWHQAVKRHIRAKRITPSEFRNRGLAAELMIDVAVDGRILGPPELVGSSGNPFYDDNAVRALTRASPLPPPPRAGRRTIIFTSEE